MWHCIQMAVAFWANCIPFSIPISIHWGRLWPFWGVAGRVGMPGWRELFWLAMLTLRLIVLLSAKCRPSHTHTQRHSWSLHSCGQFGTVVDLVGEFPLGSTSSSCPYPTPHCASRNLNFFSHFSVRWVVEFRTKRETAAAACCLIYELLAAAQIMPSAILEAAARAWAWHWLLCSRLAALINLMHRAQKYMSSIKVV